MLMSELDNFTKAYYTGNSMRGEFKHGDILLLSDITYGMLECGDIVAVFDRTPHYVHRIIDKTPDYAVTMGDNNPQCSTSEILPLIEEFLRDRHEYAARQFLVDSIGIVLRCGVLDKLMGQPEITEDTIRLAVEHWGSELIYDFIKGTGLLDVPSGNRYGMVTKLAEENRKLRNNKTTITNT